MLIVCNKSVIEQTFFIDLRGALRLMQLYLKGDISIKEFKQ